MSNVMSNSAVLNSTGLKQLYCTLCTATLIICYFRS